MEKSLQVIKRDGRKEEVSFDKVLKRIKQLGLLEHVFPSASHSRFEHSLGVSHIGENYVDILIRNSGKPHYYQNNYKFFK